MTYDDPNDPANASRVKKATAHTVFIRLALPPYTIHFKSPTYMQSRTLDLLDNNVVKPTLKTTAEIADVRSFIGLNENFWQELVELLHAAIPSLEKRSFTNWEERGVRVDYESTSGALIAGNYPALWRDLERLNDLVSISRNCLTIGEDAQDLAAEMGADGEVYRLINVCVRVTARGYDGESNAEGTTKQITATATEEEKWQWIINAYKKLLITCLQWINNFVAQNERRKIMLWCNLFDNGPDTITDTGLRQIAVTEQKQEQQVQKAPPAVVPEPREERKKPELPINTNDILLAYGTTGPQQRLSPLELEAAVAISKAEGFRAIPPQAQKQVDKKRYEPNAWVYFVHVAKSECMREFQKAHGRAPMLGEIHKNLPRFWYAEQAHGKDGKPYGEKVMWNIWQGKYEESLERYRKDLEESQSAGVSKSAQKALPAPKQTVAKQEPPKLKREQSREYLMRRVAHDPKYVDAKIKALEHQLSERYRAAAALHADPNASIYAPTVRPPEDSDTPKPAQLDVHIGPFADTAPRSFLHDKYNPLKPKDDSEREDLRMLFTADAGSKILESGKMELMKRLEGEYRHHQNDGAVGRRASLRVGGTAIYEDMKARPNVNADGARRMSESGVAAPTPAAIVGSRVVSTSLDRVEDSFVPDDLLDDEEEDEDDSDEDDEEDDEEEDEDYPGSTEDGRGLLTDVPLILGPSEIEVLPMLIMSGLVMPPPDPKKEWLYDPCCMKPSFAPESESRQGQAELRRRHSLRTHLLLSQSSGRNLLRELLIFVAAWDLREEELYFKFMVKIMEAILKNGLMPYCYHAFRDRSRSKDIISPAQAVIMKLLTCIFRQRSLTAREEISREAGDPERGRRVWVATDNDERGPEAVSWALLLARFVHSPSRVDMKLLNFIFTEFRQHIIPQTCALIFLQGQIHRGVAEKEDFPLNLWDMERMYEGVYQFLEFFAVLTEEPGAAGGTGGAFSGLLTGTHGTEGVFRRDGKGGKIYGGERGGAEEFSWKKILADWEMASELVTLLRELEGGIPKADVPAQILPRPPASAPPIPALPQELPSITKKFSVQQRSVSADAVTALKPVSVERPFDLDAGETDTMLPPLPHQPVFEAEAPLAYPEDPLNPALQHPDSDLQHDQDEPSDFEWRNLKKLTVLVLSSLLYKNKLVQDQVREYGGLETLVSCCKHDDHNPYIREHAVMCLRFAVEDNADNTEYIRSMVSGDRIPKRGDGAVPAEVMDVDGYETFLDGKGQVRLRRKDKNRNETIDLRHDQPPPSAGSALAVSSNGSKKSESTGAQAGPSSSGMTAERAVELMQNALRDLPLDKLGLGDLDKMAAGKAGDKQKADALAKLDRAFESTEKALSNAAGGSGSGKKG